MRDDLASFRGGLGEKLGNTFEGDWAVHQALLVLQADADAIQIEPVAGAGGFEFIVRADGRAHYHQCKQHAPKNKNWTISAIARTGLWTDIIAKHQNEPEARFVFVSTDPMGEAKHLAEHAARFASFAEFRAALSKADVTALSELLEQSGLASEEAGYELLACVRFETISDQSLRALTAREARRVFHGDGGANCDVLRRILNDTLTRELSTDALRGLARERGLSLRPASLDPTALEKIAKQNRRYEASHNPLGVKGVSIPRQISVEIAAALQRPDGPRLGVITGVAGSGKSGVMRQAAAILEEKGAPCLKLRLDSLLDLATADELGALLFGPHESPCLTLSLAAPATGFAVLMIDQLDAISEASGRMFQARDLALELLAEAALYRNIKVLVACRSYDLENDGRLRNLGQDPTSQRFNAGLLDIDAEVRPFFASLDIAASSLSPAQWTLVRLPVNLVTFAELSLASGGGVTAKTTEDLYREFIDLRARDIAKLGVRWSVPDALEALADWMSEAQSLTAPFMALDGYPSAADLLVSAHLLNPDGDTLRFVHESLFDYCFARAIVRRGKRLVPWLLSDEQILFRRTQVRQILQTARSSANARYLEDLEALMNEAKVRAHIKDAVASWLGSLVDPTPAELEICLSHDTGQGHQGYIARQAFANASWVRLLEGKGLISQWIESSDEARQRHGFRLLDIALDGQAELVARILHAWWGGKEERCVDLAERLKLPRSVKDIEPVVSLYLDVIEALPDRALADETLPDLASLNFWTHQNSPDVGRLMQAWYARWYRAHATGHPFMSRHSDEAYWRREAAAKYPIEFLRAMLGALAVAFAREIAEGRSLPRHKSAFRLELPHEDDKQHEYYVFDTVRRTLREAAAQDPETVLALLQPLAPFNHFAALHLALEVIDAGGRPFAKFAKSLLSHPLLFEAGYQEGVWDSAARAFASVWEALSPAARETYETHVLKLYPEIERASKALKSTYGDTADHRRNALHCLRSSGTGQRGTLARIGGERLSPSAAARLAMLNRKLPNARFPEPHDPAGYVASPIALDIAKRMGDDDWLSAIEKYERPREPVFTRTGPIGGASELARVLVECTKLEPERFTALWARFPLKVNLDYPRALARGVAESSADEATATAAALLATASNDPRMVSVLCHLVDSHPKAGADERVFDAIMNAAKSGAPPSEETARSKPEPTAEDDRSLQDLLNAAERSEGRVINSDRGVATHALAALLWTDRNRYAAVRDFTETSIKEGPSAPMRVALIRCVHAVLGVDADEGVRLLKALTDADPTPLATEVGIRLVSWTFWNRRAEGKEVLRRVLDAKDLALRPVGLWLLAHYARQDDDAAAQFEPMMAESVLARRMAANAAVHGLQDLKQGPSPRTQAWLTRLFHDTQQSVLKEAAGFGRYLAGAGQAARLEIANAFIASPAFRADPDDLLSGLGDKGAEFPDLIIAVCKAFFAAEKDPVFAKTLPGGAARHWLSRTIFAAYPAMERKPAYRARILDIIDDLVVSGVHDTSTELRAFER